MADIIFDTQTNVNTFTSGAQVFSEVAALNDGGWVVTWSSGNQDGSSDGIYMQRYNADGSKHDGEVLVNTTTSNVQQYSSIASLDDGGWIITWQGFGQGGQNYDIYQQRYHADGTVYDGETRVNTTTTFYQEYPNVAALADGGWIVTYASNDSSGPYRILQQRFSASGMPVDGEVVLDETTGGSYVRPNAMPLGDGGWITAWQGISTTTGNSVFFKHYDANGALVGDKVTVYADTGVGNTSGFVKIGLETLADGDWIIAWGDQNTVFTQRYDSDGEIVGNRINVANASGALYTDVVALPDGGWGVTWYTNNNVWMQVYSANGDAVGSVVQLDSPVSGTDINPRTAALADGRVVITWQSSASDGDSYGIVQTVVTMPMASHVTLDEDSSHTFTHGEFSFSIATGAEIVSIEVTDLPGNGALTLDGQAVTVGQTITATDLDRLIWKPEANANGDELGSLGFNSLDSNGHVRSASVMFDVTSVQDAPTAADHDFTLGENNAHKFKAADFGFSDTADGDTLASITITALPENGTLTLSGQDVALNQVIVASDIPNLVWAPAAGTHGDDMASLSFTVTDSSGSTSVSSNTITFDVTKTLEPSIEPETVVNTYTTSDQLNSSVTAVAGGGWVVTWQSPADGDSYGIYQQRYDANGAPIDGETLVNTSTSESQQMPMVSALGGGGWVVTWQSGSGPTQHIYQQAYNADGTKSASGEMQVSLPTTVGEWFPSVTALNDGGWVTTWSAYDSSSSHSNLLQQRYDSHGIAVGNAEIISTTALSIVNAYSTGIALPDGGWLITWMSMSGGASNPVISNFAQRFDEDGAPVGPEMVLNTLPIPVPAISQPSIVMLGDGGWVIGWNSLFNGVSMQRFDSDGNPLGDMINMVSAGNSGNADLVATPDGGWAVVWSVISGPTSQDIVMQFYDADGNASGTPMTVNSVTADAQMQPSASVLDDGRIVVTWTSMGGDGDTFGISQTVVSFDGTSSVTMDEDTSHTFASSEFDFSIDDGASLVSITISALPANGTLMFNGHAVSVNETIPADDLDKLIWTPDADANGNGLASFKFTSLDDQDRVQSARMKFDVTAVQDAPTAADSTVTVKENKSHTFTASEFGFSDSVDGDTLASITITGLPDNGTLTLNGQDVALNQLINASDIPHLVWTPAADSYGDDLSSLSFTVTDSGGSTSTSANTITLDVTKTPEYGFDTETAVNSYTTIIPQEPAITGLADGGWLVTWSSGAPGNDDHGIYQRRFDANGIAVGDETLVNTTIDGQQTTPSVTALSDGGWIVTWMTIDQNQGMNIFQQRYTGNGTAAGQETLVNTTSVSNNLYPEVTALSGGGWLVTWMSPHQSPNDSDIYQQRYGADGTPLGGETLVNTATAQIQSFPTVAGLYDGGWLVTWMGYGPNGDATDIYQQRYSAAGTTVGGETIVNTMTTSYQSGPVVTALPDGGWLVTWMSSGQDGSGNGVYQQRYGADGTAVGEEMRVNTATLGDQSSPSVTALSDGGWAVVWMSAHSGDQNVLMQIYDADGDPVGNETVLNSFTQGTQGYPHVAALPGGAFVVTWDSDGQTGGGYKLYQTVVEPLVSASVSLDEDTSHGFTQSEFDFSIGGNASLVSITVTAVPDHGTLTLDGQPVMVGQIIDAGALDGLKWKPDADENGDGLASFKFKTLESNGDRHVAKLTFDVAAVQDAPTAADNTITIDEDNSHTFTAADFGFSDIADGDTLSSVTITSLPANGSLTLNGAPVLSNAVINAGDLGNLVWTPAPNDHGQGLASLGFKVTDSGGSTSVSANTLTFDVTSVADAPTAADNAIDVEVDGSYTFTASDFGFSDGDGDTMYGVQVTSLPTSGTLTINGVAVTVLPHGYYPVGSFDKVVWTPDSDAMVGSQASFTFQVVDSTNTTSTDTYTFTFDMVDTAQVPTGADNTYMLAEDGSYGFQATDFGFLDKDRGDTLASITITELPANGKLTLAGVEVTANQVISAANIPDLKWTPDADQHGDALASLSFKVTDNTGLTSTSENTITFDVYSVLDVPTSADKTITVLEDGSYSFSEADFSFADADGDSFLSVIIKSVPEEGSLTLNGEPVTADQEIAATDLANLKWAPAADENGDGLASFTFVVRDDSDRPSFTGRPLPRDTSDVHTITFNVTPVADLPTAQDGPAFLVEDETYNFSVADFGFADADGDTFASITITGLPLNGSLMLNGVAVTAGQTILAGDIEDLSWTPDADQNGDALASLSFKVTDSSGATSATANTITFDVYSVSDIPTSADKTITVLEDGSYSFSEADFSFADVDGDGFLSVIIKSVPDEGTLTLNGDPVTADQEIAVADLAKLKWSPAANENGDGLASFTFAVKDDSQTLRRGAAYDTSDVHTITFNVTPVNDAPTAANDTLTVDEDGSHSFTMADFNFADIEGDSMASVTITALPENGSLTLNGVAVTAGQAVAAADLGGLKWTPAPNANGNPLTSLSFKVTDDHGATSTSAYTLTLDVTAVADAPTGTNNTIDLNEDGSHSFTASDFGFADADGDSLASVTINALPASGTLTLNGVAVTANQEIAAGDIAGLKWTPAANYHGNGMSLAFTVKDSTGSQATEANHLVFNVVSVPDAPTAADNTIVVAEDGSHGFTAADFGFADIDGDTLASITVTALPGKGSLTLNGEAVVLNQTISASDIGKLVWTPDANDNGEHYASLSFTVTDSGGQTSASAYTLDFDVTAVNDAPTGANATITLNEDSSHSFQLSDFGFADIDGDSLQSVTVSALPASGALTLNGVAVTANQVIAASDIGGLKWTPAADANGDGLATMSFKVTDSHGASSTANTLTFNVSPMPDAPTAADATIHVPEDGSHAFTVVDFGFADVDGDTLDSITVTALPESGTLTLDGVAVTANQEIAAEDIGKLVWTPAADADGDDFASLGFKVKDSSGSVSDAHTITLDVDTVSHLPTGADKTISLKEDGTYRFQESDFGFADADGDSLASVTVTALPSSGTLTLNGKKITANQVIAAAAIGDLVWKPAANDHGDGLASLGFQVTDSTGETSTEVNTITFDVDSVNDAPSAKNDSAKLTEGKSVVVNVLANDTDVDGDKLSVSSAKVTSGNGTVTVNDAGKLVVSYTGVDLDPGQKATITVAYTATDGSLTDSATLKVAVTGVTEPGDDVMGTPKNDTLIGTNYGERIVGLAGDDFIRGRGGNDSISAGAGDDRVYGGNGNDKLGAGGGNDIVRGGNGDDEIHGWGGDDKLTGGDGADTFVFHRRDGHDKITDFQTAGKAHDILDLHDIKDTLTFGELKSMMHESGKDVVIELPYGTEITLKHVDIDDLTKDHFVF